MAAVLHQVGSSAPVGDYLQGGDNETQLTFFKGESDPYAQFATNWVKLNFQQQNFQSGAVETTTYAEMQRAGDMLCHAFLVITAPPIANVTARVNYEGNVDSTTDANNAVRCIVHTSDLGKRSANSNYKHGALLNDDDADNVDPFLDAYLHNTDTASSLTRSAGPNGGVAESLGITPNIPALDSRQIFAHYGTYAPCTLIKELEVVIGTNPISKVTGLVLQANCELWTASDRLPRRAVNKSSDPMEKGSWALSAQTWVVPVPFWFNQGGYHSSLALCALSFHSIRFNLTLNPYTKSIVNGCGGDFTANTRTFGDKGTMTTVTGASAQRGTGASLLDIVDGSSTLAAPSTALSGSQFSFYMLLELIYLSDDERDTYTDMTDEILITQFQYASSQTLSASKKSVEMPLRFNHPVSHVVIAGQLQSNINCDRHAEYEGPTNPLSVSSLNPEGIKTHWMKSMKLTFNNNDRTAEQPAWFYNETVPSVNAERVPDHHFYLYSFGLSSPNGSGQFSGGADFSRLDNAFAVITANDHVFANMSNIGGLDGSSTDADTNSITGGQKIHINAFGVSANVAKFENGLLGVCFL